MFRATIYAFAVGAACAVSVAIAASGLLGATAQDPERPGLLDADGRLLGDRDHVTLTPWPTPPEDREPLYIVAVDGAERGFARSGDQCWTGKYGGRVVACEGNTASAVANVLRLDPEEEQYAENAKNPLPDWAGTPLPTTVIGDTIHVTVPAPPPLPDPNLPAVSLASGREYLAGALMLMGLAALVSKWRNV